VIPVVAMVPCPCWPRSAICSQRRVFADGGCAGDKLATALAGHGRWRIEIVNRSSAAGFHVLPPRRWVAERTFAWLNRNRRLAKSPAVRLGAISSRSNYLRAGSLDPQPKCSSIGQCNPAVPRQALREG
jgi:transposase